MKKILFIAITLLLSLSTSFAVEFYFTSTSYETNDGIVRLPNLNINFGDESKSSFELVIRDRDYIIFNPTLENVEIEGINNFDVSLTNDNKKALFSGTFEGEIKVSGLYIRTYGDESSGSIGLNYEGDNEIDLYSKGTLTINDEGDNDDDLKPLPVKDLNYYLTGDYIMLEWVPSPDLDLTYGLVRLEKNGNFYKDIRIGAKDTTYKIDLDLENFDWKVFVYAKDSYYLSEATSIEILKEEEPYCLDNMRLAKDPETKECKAFYNTCDVPEGWDIVEDCNIIEEIEEESDVVCIQVTQPAKNIITGECKIFGTPCDVPEGWKNVNSCSEIKLLDKQTYIYEKESFSLFQTKFDELIYKITKDFTTEEKNKVIEVRNDIMLILKNYESGLITKEKTIKKLKELILNYKNLIK